MPNASERKRPIRREERVSRIYRLPLSKLKAAQRALGAATATEAIARAWARHTGERLHLRRGVVDGREVLSLEGSLPPHSKGPPLHVHVDQDESGEVISGRLSAVVDGKTITLGTGERAFFPRGVRHRWWNAGDEPLVFRGKADPAGDLDQYLEGIFAIINASASGRPSLFHVAHLSLRHPSQRLSPAPAWVDRIFFRIIVAIGTLVGAYPPSGWPGAPTIGRSDGKPRTTVA